MSEARHTVDPKFVINRQGKDMVLYAGLVDAAHRAGLLGIQTAILQFPKQENGDTIIVFATAYFPGDTPEAVRRAFTGIGDANPQNVGKNIAPHFIRMAETRAKARALRDALNVGMVTVEELGDDNAQDTPRRPNNAPAPAERAQQAPQPAPADYTMTDFWRETKQAGYGDPVALADYLRIATFKGYDPADLLTMFRDQQKKEPAQ